MDKYGIDQNYPDCDWPVTRELLGSSMVLIGDGIFFDGETLAVFTPETMGSESKGRVMSEISTLKPEKILVWGWSCGKIVAKIHGYQLAGLDLGEKNNVLVRIEVEKIRFDRIKGRHWKAPERISDQVIVETPAQNVNVQDLAHLLNLVLPKVQNPTDRRYIGLFNNWFDDRGSKTFLARSRATGSTFGFLTLRILDPTYCFIAWTATQSGTKYVSDALYASAISWALENRCNIDLGFGGTSGILRFKKKWNPTTILSPKKQFLLMRT